MSMSFRQLACLGVAMCAAVLTPLTSTKAAIESTPMDRQVRLNAEGRPVSGRDGQRINYGPQDLRNPRAVVGPASRPSARGDSTEATWSFAAYGYGIGLPGIVSSAVGGVPEVYTGNQSYWYSLRWDTAKGAMVQTYVSDYQSSPIVRIALLRTAQGNQIALALGDGTLMRYDQQTKRLQPGTSGPCQSRSGTAAFRAADLDGDGLDELVWLCIDQSLVVQGRSGSGWTLPGVGGNDLVVAQMDDDAALEIATTSGKVIDTATRSVQWFRTEGFPGRLLAGDIDGDGRAELIVAEGWYWVWAYDVEKQLPKWSLHMDHDISAVALADVDGDGRADLLVGDGQWGSVHAFDPQSLREIGQIANPEHGVTAIAVADVNGDGVAELLWGAGATSSGSDHLYVARWATRSILWQNDDLTGPFVGPVVGDLDGDGVPEIVFASYKSESGYDSGRIIVVDSRTLAVRAISPGVADGYFGWTGLHDIKLRDIDGDGKLEIVVGTDYLYDGLIEIYKFSSDNRFTRVWRNATRPVGAPFLSVEVADVDGDGKLEVLGGVGAAHSGNQGLFVYAYDMQTGQEKWHTLHLGSPITNLLARDLTGDGRPEVVAQVDGGDVSVFTATGHDLQAIIDVQSTSLTGMSNGNAQQLIVGLGNGKTSIRQFDGGAGYPEVGSLQLGDAGPRGVTIGPSGAWWVGTGGSGLKRFVAGTANFQSANYGTAMGRTVGFVPGKPWVFSTGDYGLHRFTTVP